MREEMQATIAELRQKRAAATGSTGPWHAAGGDVRNEHDQEMAAVPDDIAWEPNRGPRSPETICAIADFIAAAHNHLPAILDALEQHGVELKRIGEDQDYLNRASIANEWEDRFQTQAGQIERLTAALAEAEKRIADQREEHCRERLALIRNRGAQIERLTAALAEAGQRLANVESGNRQDLEHTVGCWKETVATRDKQIAALTQERDTLERRRLQFATEKIHALDEQRKHLDSSWAKFYQLDASAEGRVTALMQERDAAYRAVGNEQELAVQMQNERDAAIARAEHWRKMHRDQGNLLDSAIARAEKAEAALATIAERLDITADSEIALLLDVRLRRYEHDSGVTAVAEMRTRLMEAITAKEKAEAALREHDAK